MTTDEKKKLRDLPDYLSEADRPACAWCGKPLPAMPMTRMDDGRLRRTFLIETAVAVGYGYECNGVFCTQTCGYRFGLAAHTAGYRRKDNP